MGLEVQGRVDILLVVAYSLRGNILMQRRVETTEDDTGTPVVVSDVEAPVSRDKDTFRNQIIIERDRTIVVRDEQSAELNAQIDFLQEQIDEIETL